jgi:hypothetical protein
MHRRDLLALSDASLAGCVRRPDDDSAGARRDAVQRAIDDATLARARLTATYERS